MEDILLSDLAKALVTRSIIITAIYSIISYFIILRHQSTADNLKIKLPLLFVAFGVVMLINILYSLGKYVT